MNIHINTSPDTLTGRNAKLLTRGVAFFSSHTKQLFHGRHLDATCGKIEVKSGKFYRNVLFSKGKMLFSRKLVKDIFLGNLTSSLMEVKILKASRFR